MSRQEKVAQQARREAGEAGLVAAGYMRPVKGAGFGVRKIRADRAYDLAKLAGSKALEWMRWCEGMQSYPSARTVTLARLAVPEA